MIKDYREKTIQGCIIDGSKPIPLPKRCDVTVRMTSDKTGKSLSIQAFNVMIMIPLEKVTDIIRVAESEDQDEGCG